MNNEDTSSSDESEVSKSSNNSNKEDILIEEIIFLQRGVQELGRELEERKKNEAKHIKYHYDEWLNEFFEVKRIKNGCIRQCKWYNSINTVFLTKTCCNETYGNCQKCFNSKEFCLKTFIKLASAFREQTIQRKKIVFFRNLAFLYKKYRDELVLMCKTHCNSIVIVDESFINEIIQPAMLVYHNVLIYGTNPLKVFIFDEPVFLFKQASFFQRKQHICTRNTYISSRICGVFHMKEGNTKKKPPNTLDFSSHRSDFERWRNPQGLRRMRCKSFSPLRLGEKKWVTFSWFSSLGMQLSVRNEFFVGVGRSRSRSRNDVLRVSLGITLNHEHYDLVPCL